jgi:hypothetical protein
MVADKGCAPSLPARPPGRWRVTAVTKHDVAAVDDRTAARRARREAVPTTGRRERALLVIAIEDGVVPAEEDI